VGNGQNYENQNVENQKELRKPIKPSQRRKELLKRSERRNQNVENVFWVDQNVDDQNVENSIKIDFRRSDLLWRHR
jgi:hypothetical protein